MPLIPVFGGVKVGEAGSQGRQSGSLKPAGLATAKFMSIPGNLGRSCFKVKLKRPWGTTQWKSTCLAQRKCWGLMLRKEKQTNRKQKQRNKTEKKWQRKKRGDFVATLAAFEDPGSWMNQSCKYKHCDLLMWSTWYGQTSTDGRKPGVRHGGTCIPPVPCLQSQQLRRLRTQDHKFQVSLGQVWENLLKDWWCSFVVEDLPYPVWGSGFFSQYTHGTKQITRKKEELESVIFIALLQQTTKPFIWYDYCCVYAHVHKCVHTCQGTYVWRSESLF